MKIWKTWASIMMLHLLDWIIITILLHACQHHREREQSRKQDKLNRVELICFGMAHSFILDPHIFR